jgi:hypothetical protein
VCAFCYVNVAEMESWDEAMTEADSESEDISEDEQEFKEKPEGAYVYSNSQGT